MPYLTLVINLPNLTIGDLNEKSEITTKVAESIQGCINLLDSIENGSNAAVVQITTRATDPGVTTDADPKSEQNTFSHL